MHSNTTHLFVYGSLRSGFKSNAYNYISQYFNFVGKAKTKGILYDMGTYPVAIPTKEEKFIVGELYTIKNQPSFDFVMAQLDDYEGIFEDDDNPHNLPLYYKTISEVLLEDNTKLNAFIYWYNQPVNDKPIVESGDVLQYFLEKNS